MVKIASWKYNRVKEIILHTEMTTNRHQTLFQLIQREFTFILHWAAAPGEQFHLSWSDSKNILLFCCLLLFLHTDNLIVVTVKAGLSIWKLHQC